MNLTPKQMAIATMVRDTRIKYGYSPTLREIGAFMGISKVTAFEHVEALVRKGALTKRHNMSRSLKVAPKVKFPDDPIDDPIVVADLIFVCREARDFLMKPKKEMTLSACDNMVAKLEYIIVKSLVG
jgi:SOS-response transcriptional repressor LexA